MTFFDLIKKGICSLLKRNVIQNDNLFCLTLDDPGFGGRKSSINISLHESRLRYSQLPGISFHIGLVEETLMNGHLEFLTAQ